MTKATKSKSAKSKKEEPETVNVVSTETGVPEPVIGETPPSVTLDEVKDIKEPEIKETEIVPEDISKEEKILRFLEKREGEIRLNDFLKSLYGVPKPNQPLDYLQREASKELKKILTKLSNEGAIHVVSDAHTKLGGIYYPDSTTGITHYHNINSVTIVVKK